MTKKILIADDHDIVVTGTSLILEAHIPDLMIDTARNYPQVAEKTARQDYDLIILDINMPGSKNRMMIPEINHAHAQVIEAQRRRLGTRRGFIAVKPNCSIQSYVPAIEPLRDFGPARIAVVTFQALSGAGKTLESWPEMHDNVIPFIKGEEEKSEQEPLKIWGAIRDGKIMAAKMPLGYHADPIPLAGPATVPTDIFWTEEGQTWRVGPLRVTGLSSGAASDGTILSPMPGRIISVAVAEGETVTKGQKLLTLEAMKMEHSLVAPFDGIVSNLDATEGGQVSEGTLLAQIAKKDG